MTHTFTGDHWAMARLQADSAEDLTRRFYVIAGHEWERHPYDVVGAPLRDDGDGKLASVVRLVVPTSRSSRSFYRIKLDEAAILDVVRRCEEIQLSPLLMYLFAHELVHVVRFAMMGQAFTADERSVREEEQRVHRLSRRILEPVTCAGLRRVIDAFNPAPGSPVN
jgi:hypothetical protein